jgi:hypothetical protein
MFNSAAPVFISGNNNPSILGMRVSVGGNEPRKPGVAYGTVLRCWNCGTQIGERQGDTLLVSSNKVEVGGIPLAPSVWRRCRGGKSNPACRAINVVPPEWLTKLETLLPANLPILAPATSPKPA